MKKLLAALVALALVSVYSLMVAAPGAYGSASPLVPVTSDAIGIPAGAVNTHAQSNRSIDIMFSLDFSNQAALDTLLTKLYTPGNPEYHHWLSPAQFYSSFAPSHSTVTALENYMAQFGASTASVAGDGTLVTFSASEGAIHSALGVSFYSFEVGGRQYYSATGVPAMPLALASGINGIEGLQDYVQFSHPAISTSNTTSASPSYVPPTSPTATSPFNPATIKEAYNFTGLYKRGIFGDGVSLSIVTAYSYLNSTLQTFDSQFGITPYRVNQVQPLGPPGNLSLETTLDAEWMTAIAPNATINVVEGPNAQITTFTSIFQYVIQHNISSVVSTSWGTPESQTPSSTITTDNNLFKQAAAQGIAITTASGDNGAYDNTSSLTPDFPSSSPFVTAVGGTWLNLTQSGSNVVRYSETAWAKSGGGISTVFPVPAYQTSLPGGLVLKGRGVPDVALNAQPSSSYFVYYQSSTSQTGWLGAGGTSFGAPIWAGIIGLENQLRNTAGEGNIGFLNPYIYSLSLTSNYSSDFHDITQGNNGYYSAGPGYDLVTGLGSPDVTNLALMLARIPAQPLSVKASATPSWGDSPLLTSLYANVSGGFSPYNVTWFLNGSLNGYGFNHIVRLDGAAVYHFKAVASDNVSSTATSFANVTVYSNSNRNPLALNASPSVGDANLSVSFSGTLQNPPVILAPPYPYYIWAFGDSARSLNKSSPSASHLYTTGGNYTALLTAYIPSSNSTGGYYTTQATAKVDVAPHLRATILANRTGGSYPLHLKLVASQKGGTPSFVYSWAYSNTSGSFTSASGVVYVNYTAVGIYNVKLTVTDKYKSSSTTAMTINVYTPMVVNITVSPSTSGVSPFNVTLHASVSGGAGGYFYEWTFDNTSTQAGNPITHVFQNGGSKSITLTVTDLAGDTAYGNVTVSVQSLGLLNLLKGEAAFVILAATVIVAALISYAISRKRKKL